jgi:hypothetical protein
MPILRQTTNRDGPTCDDPTHDESTSQQATKAIKRRADKRTHDESTSLQATSRHESANQQAENGNNKPYDDDRQEAGWYLELDASKDPSSDLEASKARVQEGVQEVDPEARQSPRGG